MLAKPQTIDELERQAGTRFARAVRMRPGGIDRVCTTMSRCRGACCGVRERGSAGGHNGMKSVIAAVGGGEFLRVRMGVKPDHPLGDLADYVLCPMSREHAARSPAKWRRTLPKLWS